MAKKPTLTAIRQQLLLLRADLLHVQMTVDDSTTNRMLNDISDELIGVQMKLTNVASREELGSGITPELDSYLERVTIDDSMPSEPF